MRGSSIVALALLACGAPAPAPGTARTPRPRAPRTITSPPPAAPARASTATAEDDSAPAGPPCASSLDCPGNLQCRGPVGCEASWACGLARDCTGDHVAWCGCDGVTFYAPERCPGHLYAHRGPCEALGTQEDLSADAEDEAGICESSADCRSGFECAGIEGCSTFWTCARRRRRCARDAVPYCSCDGTTFQASSTCPGQPFAHRGACGEQGAAVTTLPPTPPAPPPPAAAPPAPPMAARPTLPASALSVPTAPPSRACSTSRDCPSGQVCTGNEGCGTEWHCARPSSACAADTQSFCGCDGRTFRASMTCPGRPHAHRGACSPAVPIPTPATALSPPVEPPAPRACTSSSECPRGQVCTGDPGCGAPWRCERPARPCVDDTQYFCGCDGQSFRASMTCPGRPHAHRGSCPR